MLLALLIAMSSTNCLCLISLLFPYIYVVLPVPPVIDGHFFPESIVFEEGTRARLMCSINKGDPPILISWFKDGKPLAAPAASSSATTLVAPSFFHVPAKRQPGPQHYVIQTQEDFSSTVIFRSVLQTDRGQYSCVASNSAGTANKTTEFVVHCK